MIVSDDKEMIQKALKKATQARDQAVHYQHSEVGYNYRLSNISAGVGRGQIEVLEKRINEKREIFNRYEEALGVIDGIEMMPELENTYHNCWLSTMIIDSEKFGVTALEIVEHLEKNNIEARPVWKPMHMQPLFLECDYFSEEEDNSKYLYENGICLPSDTKMTVEQQEFVINEIKGILS